MAFFIIVLSNIKRLIMAYNYGLIKRLFHSLDKESLIDLTFEEDTIFFYTFYAHFMSILTYFEILALIFFNFSIKIGH